MSWLLLRLNIIVYLKLLFHSGIHSRFVDWSIKIWTSYIGKCLKEIKNKVLALLCIGFLLFMDWGWRLHADNDLCMYV